MDYFIQHNTARIVFYCRAVCVFDLSQDLRFSHDHGVNAGCHPEQVADSVVMVVRVKASGHVFRRKITVIKDERFQLFRGNIFIYGMSQNFYTVAGGKVYGFLNLWDVHDFYERIDAVPTV
jgi:hypothetical protein